MPPVAWIGAGASGFSRAGPRRTRRRHAPSIASTCIPDLWHTHIDWKSLGNRHAEGRAEVARLTYALLRHAERCFSARGAPIQIFATVHEDTGSNAIYVHSGNPHGTPFPHEFPNVQWGSHAPAELAGIVDASTHRIGRVRYADEMVHVIERI